MVMAGDSLLKAVLKATNAATLQNDPATAFVTHAQKNPAPCRAFEALFGV
jgi:uncharacterized protein YcsI (UPF0317 family)